MEMSEISANTIAEALTDLTNVAPINVLESRGSSNSEFYHQKNWIVLYPKGSTLSKLLPLFGVRVPTKLLPQSLKLLNAEGASAGTMNGRALGSPAAESVAQLNT